MRLWTKELDGMKQEDKRKVVDVMNKQNRWDFINTFLKNMVLNLITTTSYAVKSHVIKSADELKSDNLKEVYHCFISSYDNWTEERIKKEQPVHRDELKSDVKKIMNIAFTIAGEDWVYEKLAMKLYETIGKSYAKNVLKVDVSKDKYWAK